MTPLTRRQILRSGSVAGLAGLAGCTFGFGGDTDCEEGRTLHDSNLSLPDAAAWSTYRCDAANTGHNPAAPGPPEDVAVAWRYSACTEAESGVVVHDGRAYAGGLAVDGQTGTGVGGEWHGHMSTPAVADGTLYVSAHDLEARDATTGERQWTFETDVDAGALPAPTVVDGTVYVPGSIDDPTVYAIRTADRSERWRYETDDDVGTAVAVVDGTVYAVDESGTVYAIDAATGDRQWRTTSEATLHPAPPVGTDDLVLLATADRAILALNAGDGSVAWRRRPEQPSVQPTGAVAVADGTVYVTGREGTIAALDVTNGDVIWSRSTAADALGPPTIADGVVYAGAVADESGTVLSLDGASGDERWRVETREVFFGDYTRSGINRSPIVVDEYVFAATAPGDLYAIGPA